MPDAYRVATYRRIRNVDLKIPDSVSPEAADLIARVSLPASDLADGDLSKGGVKGRKLTDAATA